MADRWEFLRIALEKLAEEVAEFAHDHPYIAGGITIGTLAGIGAVALIPGTAVAGLAAFGAFGQVTLAPGLAAGGVGALAGGMLGHHIENK